MAPTSDGGALPLLSWGRLEAPGAVRLTLPIHVMPTPRPRVTRTGIAFMPRTYSQYAAQLQAMLAEAHPGPAMAGPLVVRVDVAKARPKSTILAAPRSDVDNLAKGVLDACTKTKRFWEDDVQIQALFVSKRWADHDHVTLIVNTLGDAT